MARLITQIQGREAIRHALVSTSTSLARFNVEPAKFKTIGISTGLICQGEASFSRLTSLNHIFTPTISGIASTAYVPFAFSFRYFNYMAKTHPWLVGGSIATTKAVLADIVAQKMIEKKEQLNYRRTGLFFAFGVIYSGIICNALYRIVYPTLFSSRIPQLNAICSSMADNLINTPFILFPTLYILKECLLEKAGSVKKAWQKYKSEIWEVTVTGWKVWFPAHMITFGLVPVHLRLLFVSSVSFFYFTIISLQQSALKAKRERLADIS